jgi:hypothetical protein
MKLDSPTTPRPAASWSRIDAGRRAQVQHQAACIRHVRLPGIRVKRAAVRTKPAGFSLRHPSKAVAVMAASSLTDFYHPLNSNHTGGGLAGSKVTLAAAPPVSPLP